MLFILVALCDPILAPLHWAMPMSNLFIKHCWAWTFPSLTVFTLSSHNLILIRYDCDNQFMSVSILNNSCLTFHSIWKLFVSFTFDPYDIFHMFLTCFLHLDLPCLLWQDDLTQTYSNPFHTIECIKQKSDAAQAVINYLAHLKTQGKNPKGIQNCGK